MEIKKIRKEIVVKRSELSNNFKQQAAKQILENFRTTNLLSANNSIAVYIAVNGEADPKPLLEEAWQNGNSCFLPILATTPKSTLIFGKYQKNDQLIFNKFSIPEPNLANTTTLAANDLDLVIVPLVAFDPTCNRVGMGGGYYDRTFAFRKNANTQKPLLIGIGYEFQKVEKLIPAEWDVPMDMIITEKNIYKKLP